MLAHEGNPVIGHAKPAEEQIPCLVHDLDMEPEFPFRSMSGAINLGEVEERVDSREEGAIQPTSAL